MGRKVTFDLLPKGYTTTENLLKNISTEETQPQDIGAYLRESNDDSAEFDRGTVALDSPHSQACSGYACNPNLSFFY